jgi:DNA-binding IclR family transcriptional regulator
VCAARRPAHQLFLYEAAIAAPIFAADGKIAAAIAVDAPTKRIAHRIDEPRPVIADVTARASGSDL